MKLHFYGTGSSEGFPALFCQCAACREARRLGGKNIRTRACCGIDGTLLIDFPPDTYAHSLWGGLDLTRVRTVLLTHGHFDHLYERDLVNAAPPMAVFPEGRQLLVLGPADCIGPIEETLAQDTRGQTCVVTRRLTAGQAAEADGYRILPVPASHDPARECFLYIIQKDGATYFHAHDTAAFSPEAWKLIEAHRFDCVTLDCTCVDRRSVYASHLGLPDLMEIRERMLRTGCADGRTRFIATHFAHTFAPLHDRISPIFREAGVTAAWDGMEITV